MSEESNDATQEIGLEAAGARPLFQLSLMGKVGVGILIFWIAVALVETDTALHEMKRTRSFYCQVFIIQTMKNF